MQYQSINEIVEDSIPQSAGLISSDSIDKQEYLTYWNRIKKTFLVITASIIIGVTALSPAYSKVTGSCGDCHTMHNSQRGDPMAVGGSGAGWDENGTWVGTSQASPNNTLLVSGCVGCHTSTSSTTIITAGGNKVPIVYNTVEPVNPLAGGNFHWVESKGHEYGHNVLGISDPDINLDRAPGGSKTCSGQGCHISLAYDDAATNAEGKQGCEGCHVVVKHHDDNSAYRFLQGHTNDNRYVEGLEETNWEQNPSSNVHNEYKGYNNFAPNSEKLEITHGMSSYCMGCHDDFHDQQNASSEWIRHPSDAILPDEGEYAAYTVFNPEAPVARPNLTGYTEPSSVVTPETDMVMCLSCHRPHGSPYKDMLRWNYDDTVAGGGGSGGCFICHTEKN